MTKILRYEATDTTFKDLKNVYCCCKNSYDVVFRVDLVGAEIASLHGPAFHNY